MHLKLYPQCKIFKNIFQISLQILAQNYLEILKILDTARAGQMGNIVFKWIRWPVFDNCSKEQSQLSRTDADSLAHLPTVTCPNVTTGIKSQDWSTLSFMNGAHNSNPVADRLLLVGQRAIHYALRTHIG